MSVDVLQKLITKTQDNVGVVRDQIGAILLAEMENQMALATAEGDDPDEWKLRIFVEASNPWEQFLETPVTDKSPIVNIWFDSLTFDKSASNVMERQKADAIYNIDCYGYGESEETAGGHTPGDKTASLQAAHAMMLVRNFLMAAQNTYLQLRGLVWGRWPMSINAFQPERGTDSVQKIATSRLAFGVDFNEYSPQYIPVNLDYVAIDIHRAEDGLLYFEQDFDYTRLDANAATLQIGGSATFVRKLIMVANAATLQIDGAADIVTGSEFTATAASLQIDGAATFTRKLIMVANAASLQIDGAATLPRALLFPANAETLQIDGAATLPRELVMTANAATLQIDGAATTQRSLLLPANAATMQIDGAATFETGIEFTATAASLQIDGAATFTRALIMTANAASLQIDGAASFVGASELQANAATLQIDGAASFVRKLIMVANAASLQIDGAATLPRALLLTANAENLQIDGAATMPRALLFPANAASLQIDGAATFTRALIMTANAETLQIDGAATTQRSLLLPANAATMQIDGAATFETGTELTANAATLQIDGAATFVRALIMTANAASLQIDGAATFEQPLSAWFVTPGITTGNDDGTTWEDAFDNITDAYTAASSGEQIWVKEGTLNITTTIINVVVNVAMYGGFSSALTGTSGSVAGRDLVNDVTTIDAGYSCRVILVDQDDVTIDGFVITKGTEDRGSGAYFNGAIDCIVNNVTFLVNRNDTDTWFYGGGGCRINASFITFSDCIWDGNRSGLTPGTVNGDAIDVDSGDNEWIDCTFKNHSYSNNFTAWTDAVAGSTQTFTRCTFDTNTADSCAAVGGNGEIVLDGCDLVDLTGGGIVFFGSSPRTATIKNTDFLRVDSDGEGIAVLCDGGNVLIEDCTVDDCDGALELGVITVRENSLTIRRTEIMNCEARNMFMIDAGTANLLENCIIHDCVAGSTAAAMVRVQTTGTVATVNNCVISGNTADEPFVNIDTDSTLYINNCIIWGNTGDGDLIGNNLVGSVNYSDFDDSYTGTGTGNISSDPDFIGSGNDPYNIESTSPCIDAGDGDEAPTLDYLGNARYDDPLVTNTGTGTPAYTDIGAYEYQGT